MPTFDATFVGKLILPEVSTGPVPPGQGGGRPPLGFWGGAGEPFPTPPIVIPIPPDAIAPGVPTHPIYLPVFPAHPIVIPPGSLAPGVPTHPIYYPPVIWGPNDPRPTPPMVIPPDAISPGVPSHPIYLPPTIWPPGSNTVPHPSHPIALPPTTPIDPPTEPPTEPPDPNWQWVWVPDGSGGGRWTPGFVPEGGPGPH